MLNPISFCSALIHETNKQLLKVQKIIGLKKDASITGLVIRQHFLADSGEQFSQTIHALMPKQIPLEMYFTL